MGFDPWIRKIPWSRAQQPTPVFLPGESHRQRNLVDYSPQGHRELDMTEVTEHAEETGLAHMLQWNSALKEIPLR